MPVHKGILCDGCAAKEFGGLRYRCEICNNYDLCGECYDNGKESLRHVKSHPMECVPEPKSTTFTRPLIRTKTDKKLSLMSSYDYTQQSMMFNNIFGMLNFYSSSSKEGTCSISDTISSLKSSLSKYSNIEIIDCGSFEERLYIPLLLMDPIDNETTLNVDSDHLIVDADYLAYEFNDAPITVESKVKILLLKHSVHSGCVYLYNAEENLDIPWKSADFMLQQIQKYQPKLNVANDINFDKALSIRTGPSFAATSGIGGDLGSYVSADLVFCVKCQQWPIIAKEWLSRESKTGWPTRDTKYLIESNGCYIVPTGFDDDEWRLSFSLAELQLINTLDREYKEIYAVIKFLIKYACKNQNIIGLKSYHLKTIFLWYCEERSIQKNVSIKDSLEDLLNYIIGFYRRKYIPQYFIPTCNLLFEKSTDELELYYAILSTLANNLDTTLIQFIDNTYYSFVLLDSSLLELYSKNDSRLLLFFKYNFLLYSLYGILDNGPPHFSSQYTTDIDYSYYFSLITMRNEDTLTVDQILNTIELNIQSDKGEYLISQNIEMAFCVLQIVACMERESLVNFFTRPADKTFAKLLKDRNEAAFEIFGEWMMEDLTAGIKSCECHERKNI